MSALLPQPTPESEPFWTAVSDRRLALQRGRRSGTWFFPPRSFDPFDRNDELVWSDCSGRATLVSFVVNHRPPPNIEVLSSVIAIVELQEGPRLTTNVVDADAATLAVGMRLHVVFRSLGGRLLPAFAPEEVAR